jgi:hypothetical protein
VNRYILIRRLRGPAFLLLVGVNALLAQAHILGWGRSWPFYLILAGLLLLAERAALASEGYPLFPGGTWPGAPQATNSGAGQGAANSGANAGTAIVPSQWKEFENGKEGGQS